MEKTEEKPKEVGRENEEKLLNEIMTPRYPFDPYEVLGERNFEDPRVVPKSEKGTPVQEFYRDATIFVTGATGFLGMVLIEKLLRSCPHLHRVYVLVRTKKGQEPQERYNETLENPIFKRLRHEVPHFKSKLAVISGAVDEENMGLAVEDKRKLVHEVNVVFHCAATVRFDEKLSTAISINLMGTREVLKLGKEMRNLKVFMYVSTAYSNCYLKRIEEKVYPNKYDYEDIIKMVKANQAEELDQLEVNVLQQWPNTYTFSKSLAEVMVNDQQLNFPTAIFRPSVVVSTYREPIKGWASNLFGPNGIQLAFDCGIIHTFHGDADYYCMDSIPVDFVVNGLICTACETAKNFKTMKEFIPDNVAVFNCVNGSRNTVTWKEVREVYFSKVCKLWPYKYTMWYPSIIDTECYPLYFILSFFLQTIFGYFVDIILSMMGIKFSLTKLYSKMFGIMDKVSFFIRGSWSFGYRRMDKIWKHMSPEDKELFWFDVHILDLETIISTTVLGIREYYLNEGMSSLPSSRKRMERLQIAHNGMKFLFRALVVYLIYRLAMFFFSSWFQY